MKRLISRMIVYALVSAILVCVGLPAHASEDMTYAPMDLFGEAFNPFGMDWSGDYTVFEASFEKGGPKWEGEGLFSLSMAVSGNMFACVAYQADIAGLSEDERNARVNEYLEAGYCHIDGTDGRWVDISRADPNDDRYEYVEADGQHGQTGAGCVVRMTLIVDEADVERYTQLIRDNYSMEALTAVTDYMDVATDFSECGIYVGLYKNEVKTTVTYYVPDTEAIRKNIAANVKSDWWEWNGNQEGWIQYDDIIGNKLIIDTDAGAITVSQEGKLFGSGSSEGNYGALGFSFDDAGTCGVYEEHEPFYSSVAVARPEWGDFSEAWNMEFNDSNVNGYGVTMWYYADEDRYEVQADRDGDSCKYTYFKQGELDWCYPDADTVRQMFNAAFGTDGDGFYQAPYENFERYTQERFKMGVDELYQLPKDALDMTATELFELPFEPLSLKSMGFVESEEVQGYLYNHQGSDVYFDVSIHDPKRAAWEGGGDVRFFTPLSDEYRIVVTYYTDEKRFGVGADDNDGGGAKYDFYIDSGEFIDEWCGDENLTVAQYFMKAINDPMVTDPSDVYEYSVKLMVRTVEETFGMGLDELYALYTD